MINADKHNVWRPLSESCCLAGACRAYSNGVGGHLVARHNHLRDVVSDMVELNAGVPTAKSTLALRSTTPGRRCTLLPSRGFSQARLRPPAFKALRIPPAPLLPGSRTGVLRLQGSGQARVQTMGLQGLRLFYALFLQQERHSSIMDAVRGAWAVLPIQETAPSEWYDASCEW